MLTVQPAIERVSKHFVEQYRHIAPATLGHKTGIRFMHSAIKPVFPGARLVGPAVTVYAPGMDVGILTKLEEVIQPGDVIVVDRGGDYEHACIGEIRALRHIRLGVAGWIVDGAITDVLEIREMRFPVFSRTVSALVGQPLNVDGYINDVIQCGGVPVRPGELIVADDNGIAVLSEEEAQRYLADALAAEEREKALRLEFAAEYKKLRNGQ